ncbi:MAG: hypothetical protein E6G12_04970 [Actinobacteria bacterium]|nr:MAG: hypothetical protein E6G12_04970 [Actinomycetota bacterium]
MPTSSRRRTFGRAGMAELFLVEAVNDALHVELERDETVMVMGEDVGRAGGVPTFIEAVTYRAAPHATADDPSAYIDLDRVEEEKRNECVGRYEGYLRRLGVLDDAVAEEIKNEALEKMRQGIAAAEAEPEPDPELVFDNAYVLPPPNLREGWDG